MFYWNIKQCFTETKNSVLLKQKNSDIVKQSDILSGGTYRTAGDLDKKIYGMIFKHGKITYIENI